MARVNIVALANAVTRVTVYEPRQTPEQPENVLDEFELQPGEVREYELRSATAAYRQEPSPGPLPEDFGQPLPDQEPVYGVSPDTGAEMAAGGDRLRLAEDSRVEGQEAQRRDLERRAAHAPPRTGKADMPKGKSEEHKPAHAGKGKDTAAAVHERNAKRKEEKAVEKTKGQERSEALNPSPQTGTTGQSDQQAEVSAVSSEGATGEAAVEQNKAPDERSA